MHFVFDIVSRFVPPELNAEQTDIFISIGCLAFIAFIFYIAYRIVRLFI